MTWNDLRPTEHELGIILGFTTGVLSVGGPIVIVFHLVHPVSGQLQWQTIYLLGVSAGAGPVWVAMYFSENIAESLESIVRGLA